MHSLFRGYFDHACDAGNRVALGSCGVLELFCERRFLHAVRLVIRECGAQGRSPVTGSPLLGKE